MKRQTDRFVVPDDLDLTNYSPEPGSVRYRPMLRKVEPDELEEAAEQSRRQWVENMGLMLGREVTDQAREILAKGVYSDAFKAGVEWMKSKLGIS